MRARTQNFLGVGFTCHFLPGKKCSHLPLPSLNYAFVPENLTNLKNYLGIPTLSKRKYKQDYIYIQKCNIQKVCSMTKIESKPSNF